MAAAPVGRWVHVREESGDGLTVYRPQGAPLPPARGREELELHPDGTLTQWDIGPDDAPRPVPGSWSLTGTRLRLCVDGRPERTADIAGSSPDRLELADCAADPG